MTKLYVILQYKIIVIEVSTVKWYLIYMNCTLLVEVLSFFKMQNLMYSTVQYL